ncbi:MAG: PQQ-binding-like beta-propeller repeat protein [Ignavibacteriales bacterium]|nr:PQQ-binding-like beta-propeller repeat protein [Ignavibacteriales bacterium]
MKRLILIIILLASVASKAQTTKFAFVHSSFNVTNSTAQIDSLISKLNADSSLSFVCFVGTAGEAFGTTQDFGNFKLALDKLNKPYNIVPYQKECRDYNCFANFLEYFGDDKFVINGGSFVFIGINPALPFSNIIHYTIENLNWLEETLDTFSLAKEIYFISPIPFDEIGNSRAVLSLLAKKNIKLIISGNAAKNQQQNILGINAIDLRNSFESESTTFSIFNITKDSVIVYQTEKVLAAFDKTIQQQIENSAEIDYENFSAEVKTKIDLASTLGGSLYWEDKIFTAEESGLISCYDTTGTLLWDYDTYGTLISAPVISDRLLTAATANGDIITLSAISGEQIQSIGFEQNITTDLTVLGYTGNKILMIPKLTKSNSALIFGTASGKIFCYDLETLQEYWVNESAKGMIKTKPLVVENKILFGSYDGYIYCIDSRSGLLIWRWKEKAETDFSFAQILSDGKRVFAVSNNGTTYCIDLLLGKLIWKNETNIALQHIGFSVDKKSLYLKCAGKKICRLKSDNGKLEKEFKVAQEFDNSFDSILELNGTIIYSNRGTLYSVNEKSKEEKLVHIDNAPVIALEKINNKIFAATLDGRILLFTLR